MREELVRVFSIPADSPHLDEALTHPSYANELRLAANNQRLEFLGDAVLELCVSELLYERFGDADEGALTRMRAQLVNTEALAAWGRQHGVAEALMVGRGAEASGLRQSTSVLADTVEALVAAAYLSGGFEQARTVVGRIVKEALDALEAGPSIDAKTALQELVQSEGLLAPTYETVESWGPAHERWFRVRVLIEDESAAEGLGRSKRAAERAAAALALEARQDRAEAPALEGGPGEEGV
jgi:ribonuclease-3